MAKNSNTPKLPPVELPNLTVNVSNKPLETARGGSRKPNPLNGAVELANNNRDKSYEIPGLTDKRQAQKVISLLQRAGAANDCSVRTQYVEAEKLVRFQARDRITRKSKLTDGE